MSKQPHIRIDFTLVETGALISAAGEVMNHEDVVEQSFSGPERSAARRAYQKLLDAYRQAVQMER